MFVRRLTLRRVGIAVLAFLLALSAPARADECADAVDDYNAVLGRLLDAMQHFSACVADSKGTDACAADFARLRAAYGEYASTVATYKRQCL